MEAAAASTSHSKRLKRSWARNSTAHSRASLATSRAARIELMTCCAQQAQAGCLADDFIEEALGDFVLEQPSAVLGEHRGVKTGLQQAHVQEPAVQELVVELLTEGTLTATRVQRNQQRRLEQPLRRNGRSAARGIHLVG